MAAAGYLGIMDYIAIATVLLISAGIGVYFRFSGGKQKTADEFLMASRNMSPFPVIFSLVVTCVSAIMMIGTPAEIYNFGLYRIIAYFTSLVSNVIAAYLFLPVYFQMGTVSVYQYLEVRFGKTARNMASIFFILQTVFYIAVVLYAPALALSAVISTLPIWASVISIGVVCTFYSSMGGLKAVLWTDVFQAIIMFITVIALFAAGVLAVGGFWEVLVRAQAGGRLVMWNFSTSLSDRYTLFNCLTYGFFFGMVNNGCNQAQVQRMLSVRNLKKSQKSVILSVPLSISFIVINFLLGIILYAYFHDCDPLRDPNGSQIKAHDQLVPLFILKELTRVPGLAGICVAGIFSGSLSTVSSAVNSLSAVTMEDFVRPYYANAKLTEKRSAQIVKMITFSYGLIGIMLSFVMSMIVGIAKSCTMVFSTVSGPILGMFVLGMMTLSANEKGAVTGLITGFVASLCLVTNTLVHGSSNEALVLNTHGCASNATLELNTFTNNQSYAYNLTSSMLPEFISTTPSFETNLTIADTVNRQTSGDISFMWIITVGFIVTASVGYIVSFIFDRNDARDVDPVLISPPFRKWLFSPLPQSEEKAEQEMKFLDTEKTVKLEFEYEIGTRRRSLLKS